MTTADFPYWDVLSPDITHVTCTNTGHWEAWEFEPHWNEQDREWVTDEHGYESITLGALHHTPAMLQQNALCLARLNINHNTEER